MDAADAIEELLARDVVPTDFHERCLQLEIRKRIELEKRMPYWISVKERLPENGKFVLVSDGDDIDTACRYKALGRGIVSPAGLFCIASGYSVIFFTLCALWGIVGREDINWFRSLFLSD